MGSKDGLGFGLGFTVRTYSGTPSKTEGVEEKKPVDEACSRAAFSTSMSCCVLLAKNALRQAPPGRQGPAMAAAGVVAPATRSRPEPPCAMTLTRAGFTALANPTTSVSAQRWKLPVPVEGLYIA